MRSLYAMGIMAVCSVPLHAAEIVLSNPTDWNGGYAPGYTGVYDDYYNGSGIIWDIHSGTYTVATSSSSCSLRITGGTLNNNGSLIIQSERNSSAYGIIGENSTLTNFGTVAISTESANKSAYGISGSGAVISNENGASLTIWSSSCGTESVAYGIRGSSGSYATLINCGTMDMDITTESTESPAYGLQYARINNGAGASLNLNVQSKGNGTSLAYGIRYGTLTNSSVVNITAETASSSACGIGDASITNEAEGTLVIQSVSTGSSSSAYGIDLYQKTLTNKGLVNITAESTRSGAWGISATSSSITNEANASLMIQSHGRRLYRRSLHVP